MQLASLLNFVTGDGKLLPAIMECLAAGAGGHVNLCQIIPYLRRTFPHLPRQTNAGLISGNSHAIPLEEELSFHLKKRDIDALASRLLQRDGPAVCKAQY